MFLNHVFCKLLSLYSLCKSHKHHANNINRGFANTIQNNCVKKKMCWVDLHVFISFGILCFSWQYVQFHTSFCLYLDYRYAVDWQNQQPNTYTSEKIRKSFIWWTILNYTCSLSENLWGKSVVFADTVSIAFICYVFSDTFTYTLWKKFLKVLYFHQSSANVLSK